MRGLWAFLAAAALIGCAPAQIGPEIKAAEKPLAATPPAGTPPAETPLAEKPPTATPPAAKPLTEFSDANFGVHFSHTDALSTEYNPHGGADQVLLAWRGKPIGGLKIASRPPAGSTDEFIAAGLEYYKQKYGTSAVSYGLYVNRNGYKWHHITAQVKLEGDAKYVLERFVCVPEAKAVRSSEPVPEQMFGSYSFEFLFAEADGELVGPEITTVINSFRIADQP